MKRTKILSLLLAAALTISSAFAGTEAEAAKKPKLSSKKQTVYIGKTKTIKVKNGNKKAKVTWKVNKKKIATISKKATKGNKAYAKVKGRKKGSAVLTATYKLGKKKTVLKCKLTVKKAPAPAPTATPTVAPTDVPVVPTDAPATDAPATDAPADPTEKPADPTQKPADPTEKPADPTQKPADPTNPPLYEEPGDINMVLSADTVHPAGCEWFFTDPAANTYNDDGSVTFLLKKEANPVVGFFFNAEKLGVDLTKYTELKMVVSSDVDNVSVRAAITDSQEFKFDENSNWLANVYGTVNTSDTTLTISLNGKSGIGYGVGLQHCGWNTSTPELPNITIKSITLVAKEAAPADPTEAPADPTEAPADPTEAPADPTEAPADPTEAPADPTEAPADPTEAPVQPIIPSYVLDLATAETFTGAGAYNAATGTFDVNDTGDTVVYFALPETIANGEKVSINIKGTWTGTKGFRFWIGNGPNAFSDPKVFQGLATGEFDEEFVITATDACSMVTLKNIPSWSNGGPIDGLSLSEIKVTYVDREIIPTPTPVPTPAPIAIEGTFVAKEQAVALTADKLPAVKPDWFFTELSNYTFNADGSVTIALVGDSNAASSLYFNADKSAIRLGDYEKMVVTLSVSEDGHRLRGGFTKSADLKYDGNIIGQELYISPGTSDYVLEVPVLDTIVNESAFGFCIQNVSWESQKTGPVVTVKSVKLVRKAGDFYNYTAASDVNEFLFSYTKNNGDVVEENLDMALVDEYMDKYDEFLAPLELAMNKAAGFEITKYNGEEEITFVKTAADAATITTVVGDTTKTANVTFAKDGNVTTATITTAANTVKVEVDSANANKAYVTKNGVSGYVVEGTKTADGYVANVTTPAGNYATITKTADGYVVNVAKDSVENRDFAVAYR